MRPAQITLITALTLAAMATTSCAQVTSKTTVTTTVETKDEDDKPEVVLDTNMGKITLQLDRAKAPATVENFLKYVDDGFYDGLVFHRVMPDFMIQGGGMKEDKGRLELKTPTYPDVKNESKTGLSNVRGTIAMARKGNPNSANCQFFINLFDKNKRLDNAGGGYTAFGKVTDGMDVVDAIAKAETDLSEDRTGGVPLKPIVIKSAKRKAKS